MRVQWRTHCGDCGTPFFDEALEKKKADRASFSKAPNASASKVAAAVIGVVVLGALGLVITLAGLVLFVGHPIDNANRSAPNDVIALQASDNTSANGRANSLILGADAFADGWSLDEPGIEAWSRAKLDEPSRCFPDDPQMKIAGGSSARYTFNSSGGSLAYTTLVAPNVESAKHQMDQFATAAYESCVISDTAEMFNENAIVSNIKSTRVNRDLPVNTISIRVTAKQTAGKKTHNVSAEFIQMQKGDRRIRLVFAEGGTQAPPPDKDAIINKAAQVLAAS